MTPPADGAGAVDRFTTDDLARPLALGPGARRIVSLAPSCTESLLALGAGDRLVGVDEHSELPPALGHVPRIGGFKDVDVDRIAALAPDLVVAASLHAVAVVPRLASAGLRVFSFLPRTLDDVVDGMARLASVIGVARPAAPWLAAARARIARVVERTVRGGPRPLVYVELSPRGHTGGPQSFVHDLVTKAGGVNAGGLARVEWPVLSAQTVRRLDPDVVVIARYPGSASPEAVAARDGWDRVAAVKSHRVFELPSATLKHPGPVAIEGLERVSAILAGHATT